MSVETHVHSVKERKAVAKELAALMNKYGWDDWCNTPDYLLAEFIVDAVQAYGRTMNRNMLWHSGWKPLGGENEYTGAWCCEDELSCIKDCSHKFAVSDKNKQAVPCYVAVGCGACSFQHKEAEQNEQAKEDDA